MEEMTAHFPLLVIIVTIDITICKKGGNILKHTVLDKWLQLTMERKAKGVMADPPCDRWTSAKWAEIPQLARGGPLPPREAASPWARAGIT